MEITIDGLLLGKSTIIKGIEYLETREYVEDFLKETSKLTNKYIVQVEMPKQLTLTKNNKDITYNKVWIQAILPSKINEYNEVIGLVYALDIKTPCYKIYRAYLDPETKNTVVFNKNWLQIGEIKPNEKFKFSISNLMSITSNFEVALDTLKGTYYSPEIEDIHKILGNFIECTLLYEYETIAGKVKLSTSEIIKAYQEVFMGLNETPRALDFYNSINNCINDNKDIINRFEKSLVVGMLFGLVEC